jgi:zinc protease
MYRTLLLTALAALFCASAVPLAAQTAGEGQRPVPIDPNTTYGKLDNGLTYYIRPNKRPENRAELRLVVRVGSIVEDADQQGLAHFVEHMAFNGTKNFKKQELVNYLESIGVKFGPHLNAYTSFDETVYMLQVPTDSAKQLQTGIQILEDWAHNLSFDETEIDKERGVVREEWRSNRGAWARMNDATFPVMFKGSRYAERLPIGKVEVIDTAKYETVRRFYKDWYRPDLMSVIAVGDFDRTQVEALIRKHFSRIPAATSPRPREQYPVPDQPGTDAIVAVDVEADMANVDIMYRHPVSSHRTESDYRDQLVEELFSSLLNERLEELRSQPNPPFAFAFGGTSSMASAKEFFNLSAFGPEDKVQQAFEAIATEAERVRAHGFTATELERQKKEILRNLEKQYEERDKTESGRMVWGYVSHALDRDFVPGIEEEYQLASRMVPGIRLEEINRLAAELITRENRVISVQAPEKKDVRMPTEKELIAALEGVERRPVTAYRDEVSSAPLMMAPASAAKVVAELRNEKLGLVEWKLANGVRVIVKPTSFKNDEVVMRAYSPGGSSLVTDDAVYDAISSASSVIGQSGVGEFDKVGLSKKLAGQVAYVSPMVSWYHEGMRGGASPKDIETMMQLTNLYFTAPRADSGAFNMHKTMMSTFAKNMGATPEGRMQDTLQVTLAQYHPRSKPFSQKSLDDMDLRKSYEFYRDRFADAGDFTFIFVGNIDTSAFKPLVARYLGTLPSTGRVEQWRDVGSRYPKGRIEKTINAGIEPKSQVRVVMTGDFEWTDENRHLLTSTAAVLRIMLREVLREEMGGTYGVMVNASPSHVPVDNYRVDVGFGCAPERVPELTRAMMATIDSLKRYGPSEANLQKVKEAQRRERETKLKENGYWADQIETAIRNGSDPMAIIEEEEMIDALTTAKIKEAANRFFDAANSVKVVLYPQTTVAREKVSPGE